MSRAKSNLGHEPRLDVHVITGRAGLLHFLRKTPGFIGHLLQELFQVPSAANVEIRSPRFGEAAKEEKLYMRHGPNYLVA